MAFLFWLNGLLFLPSVRMIRTGSNSALGPGFIHQWERVNYWHISVTYKETCGLLKGGGVIAAVCSAGAFSVERFPPKAWRLLVHYFFSYLLALLGIPWCTPDPQNW